MNITHPYEKSPQLITSIAGMSLRFQEMECKASASLSNDNKKVTINSMFPSGYDFPVCWITIPGREVE